MALTDVAIARLEELNLAEARRPDPMTEYVIAEVLRNLPEMARHAFPGLRTVQQALDGFFEVQAVLLSGDSEPLPSGGGETTNEQVPLQASAPRVTAGEPGVQGRDSERPYHRRRSLRGVSASGYRAGGKPAARGSASRS